MRYQPAVVLHEGEHFYGIESWVAPLHGVRMSWSSCYDVECVGWKTPTWKAVVDIDVGTPSSGDCRGHLEVKDIALGQLECFISQQHHKAVENFTIVEPEHYSRPWVSPDDKEIAITRWGASSYRHLEIGKTRTCCVLTIVRYFCVSSTSTHARESPVHEVIRQSRPRDHPDDKEIAVSRRGASSYRHLEIRKTRTGCLFTIMQYSLCIQYIYVC